MRKNGTFSNQERYEFRKAIRNKLESAGITDTIVMRATKKVRAMLSMDSEGKPQIQQVPMLQAQNLQRRLIRSLLATNSRKTVEAFLSTDLNKLSGKTAPTDPAAE
jgi:hypothetical protein